MSKGSLAVRMIVTALVLSACAGQLRGMHETAGPPPAANQPPGTASVVFMRPSGWNYEITSSVFELRGSQDVFIGHVPAKKKLMHYVAAGPSRFMVVSEAADFLQAELEAGKTYYVLVTPRPGGLRARFSLRPVTASELDGGEFRGWLDACVWIETTEEARDWARRNAPSVQAKRIGYLEKWEPRMDKPTLKASDGR